MFFVSHLYFDRVKRPSSGWMAVTTITHHYYMITNKFENLHALQRKINTRALLPDARPSRPILAVKKITYIQALRLNTVQPIGPLTFFIPESRFFPCNSNNVVYLLSCKVCHAQYVGSTTTKFRVRFNNHKVRFKAHSRLFLRVETRMIFYIDIFLARDTMVLRTLVYS